MMKMLEPPAAITPSDKRRPLPRYDHSAFYSTVRPTDVFICSFPKSGTTWLGYLIAQILKGDAPVQLGLNSFNDYVPDVNLLYTKRGDLSGCNPLPDPRFLLCHAACDLNLSKAVYVLRDPRDTMVSYWHYHQFLNKDFNLSLADFLRSNDIWPCDWDQHVASWLLPRKHPNLVVVKYEDLHSDPLAALKKVADLAGVRWSEPQMEAAIEASRFDRMRAAELRFGVEGKAGNETERFVRKGRVGSWREEMGTTELRILEQKYGSIMQQVGYPTAGNI